MSAEIKPCPFCAGTNTVVERSWWVRCRECETTGPDGSTAAAAIAAWNAAPRPGEATLTAEPPEGFVRVRVAVTVDERGGWGAWGQNNMSDAEAVQMCGGANGDALTWLTAHVRKRVKQVHEAVAVVEAGDGGEG